MEEKENLSKQQKKNRKKREVAKRKKEQAKESSEDNPVETLEEKEQVIEEPIDKFEDELCWCIQQIEIGMRTQKPTSDQATKSKKLMTQLRSIKTPKPKKRMLMKNNFGDYRRKMTDQLKISNIVPPKIVDVNEELVKKSVFVKKKANDLPPMPGNDNNNSGFMFNFPDPI